MWNPILPNLAAVISSWHTLCSQSLQAVSVEIPVSVTWHIFLLVLYLLFLFFLHLPHPLTHFSLLWGVEEKKDRAFQASLLLVLLLCAWCPHLLWQSRSRAWVTPVLPAPHPPHTWVTAKTPIPIPFHWQISGVGLGFFFLLKMYPYTLHLNTLWNSPCEKQTDVMLCALQVVALLICCFPNNSRFFYFASVFVASCYLLAKTKQASLVSKAFHQLSHQHFASLVSFAFVLCLLHSH